MRKFNMRKITALLNRIKDWSMMYRDDVGRSVDKEMIRKINTVCQAIPPFMAVTDHLPFSMLAPH